MRNICRLAALAVLIAATVTVVQAFGLPQLPGIPGLPDVPGVEIPGLEDIIADLIKEDPPVSTSLEDAVTATPWLDGYGPTRFSNGLEQPRDKDGSWLLAPGAYEFTLESYCLHAGTSGPGGGEGYLLAPLKGSRAKEIGTVLENTWRYPELAQEDIQVLLWGIEARTRINDMPPGARAAAEKLFDRATLRRLNGRSIFDRLGGQGGITDEVLNRVLAKLPPEAQAPFQAQAKIHNMMVNGSPTIDQLEALAVLPAIGPGPEDVPLGRWSWHPNGYFIRYDSSGYDQTVVQIIVPLEQKLERDELGRIVSLTDADGWRVETIYDDAIEPMTLPDHPNLRAYAFRTIRFSSPDPDNAGQVRTHEINDQGWTFVGRPNLKALKGQATRPADGFGFARWSGSSTGGLFFAAGNAWENAADSAAALRDRMQDGYETYEKLEETRERIKQWNDKGNADAVDDLTDIRHYEDGLEIATNNDPEAKLEWIQEQLDRVERAWEWASSELAGGNDEADNNDGKKNRGGTKFNGGDVATPGNRGRQRLGQSRR